MVVNITWEIRTSTVITRAITKTITTAITTAITTVTTPLTFYMEPCRGARLAQLVLGYTHVLARIVHCDGFQLYYYSDSLGLVVQVKRVALRRQFQRFVVCRKELRNNVPRNNVPGIVFRGIMSRCMDKWGVAGKSDFKKGS